MHVGRATRLLIISDFIFYFALGLLSPIFAIFILENITDSTLQAVGVATTMYWLARVLTTVPISVWMDRTDGEKDEYICLIIGSILMSTLPLLFLVATKAWHVYAIEFMFGIAGSLAVPAWRILFTHHITKRETGYSWSLEDIGIGIATAGSAYVGALIADRFGFDVVFICLTILGLFATVFVIPLYKDLYSRDLLLTRERVRASRHPKKHSPHAHVRSV